MDLINSDALKILRISTGISSVQEASRDLYPGC